MSTLRPQLVLATGLLAGLAACSPVEGEGYNVVLVTLDTTRPDFFGCYGRPGEVTPHFDALAADGVRFGLAMSTSAVTPVSHASILTGLNQYEHGLRVLIAADGFRLSRRVPTLAGVLKDAGYRTAAVHSAFPVSGFFGFDAGFDLFEGFDVGLQTKGQHVGWDTSEAQRRSDETTELVLDYLDGSEEPFFLWIHYWDPHDPLLTPPEEYIPADTPRVEAGYPPSSQLYAAELRYVDEQFGRVVAELRRRGVYERTLIVVVADHGEGLEDGEERHGWPFHRVLYNEQIHVPLIVRLPGVSGGRVVEDLVSTIDVYPTVLDYLGLELPRPVSGGSLRDLIEGRDVPPRFAYADQINYFDANASILQRRPEADFLYSVTDGEWKLIYRPTRPKRSELYNLHEDPLELDNRFLTEREVRVRMLEELARREPWVLEPFEGQASAASEEARRMLTALGYGGSEGGPPIEWEWVCPRDQGRAPQSGRCPDCGTPRMPVVASDE